MPPVNGASWTRQSRHRRHATEAGRASRDSPPEADAKVASPASGHVGTAGPKAGPDRGIAHGPSADPRPCRTQSGTPGRGRGRRCKAGPSARSKAHGFRKNRSHLPTDAASHRTRHDRQRKRSTFATGSGAQRRPTHLPQCAARRAARRSALGACTTCRPCASSSAPISEALAGHSLNASRSRRNTRPSRST